MAWQKIDDQFGISKKVIRIPRKRRQRCVGLWLLAGNYASRTLSDGILEAHELDELDAIAADVEELIRVELWHGHGHDCERCAPVDPGDVVIHDYLAYNPTKAKVLSDREAERVRKMSQRDKKRTPDGHTQVSEHPVPSRPDPVLLTDVTTDIESSHLPDSAPQRLDESALVASRFMGIVDLRAVAENFVRATHEPLTLGGAVELARAILSKAKGDVRDVDAYLASVCRKTPGEVQQAYFDLDIEGVA